MGSERNSQADTPTFTFQMDLSNDNDYEVHRRQPRKSSSSKSSMTDSSAASIKMSGYLEKRSKMLGWKRFWFVLDGRLLTYYKSKSEYEGLSACSGSVNVGIATNVSPIKASKGYPLQIVTRTQIYYLRASDKAELDRWLIAIQEAATIPPNISLPYWTDPGVQFYRYSFTALSQWSLDASTDDLSSLRNLPQNFYRPTSLLKKCHSFVALNLNLNKANWRNNNYVDYNNHSDLQQQSYNTYHSTLGYKSSTKCKEMQEIITRNKSTLNKMRHTSSMLVLESSPQAGELRRELARKLSTPVCVQSKREEVPAKAFPGALQDQVCSPHLWQHPFGNIYTNCQTTSVQHEYDEILDLNHGIYEPCGLADGSGLEGIYENVDGRRGLVCASTTSEDPWEKLCSNKCSAITSGSEPTRNRRSLQSRESSGTLVSIAEIPEKESTASAAKMQLFYDIGVSADICDRSSDKESDSTSNYDGDGKHKGKNNRLSKRHSITGFFHKIFTKDKKRKETEGKDLVISGPVDLREMQRDREVTREASVDLRSSRHQQTQLNMKQSRLLSQLRGLKPAVGSNINSSENLLQELHKKIGERRRSSGEDCDLRSVGRSDGHQVDTLAEETQAHKQELSLRAHSPFDQSPAAQSQSSAVPNNPNSAEYLRKLARFNRLSASLNPSFVAALGHSTCGEARNNSVKVARSHSCRVRSLDHPPMLPPKQKPSPKLSEYDVPQNNSPVRKQGSGVSASRRNVPVTELTKKRSAPDISLSSATPSAHPGSHRNSRLAQSLEFVKRPNEKPSQIERLFSQPEACERVPKTSCVPQTPPRPPKSESQSVLSIATQIPQCERKSEGIELRCSCKVADCKCFAMTEETLWKKTPSEDQPTGAQTPSKSSVCNTLASQEMGLSREALTKSNESIVADQSAAETSHDLETRVKSRFAHISQPTILAKYHEEKIEKNCQEHLAEKIKNFRSCEIIKNCEEIPKVEEENCKNLCVVVSGLAEDEMQGTARLGKVGDLEQPAVGSPRTISGTSGVLASIMEMSELTMIAAYPLHTDINIKSPTASNKSGDIDNLEMLSDISSDPCELSVEASDWDRVGREESADLLVSPSPSLHIQVTQANCQQQVLEWKSCGEENSDSMLHQNVPLTNTDVEPFSTAVRDETDDGSHFYDDVPYENAENFKINYATLNSVPWESVQETEEEIYELYDEFPADNNYSTLPVVQTAVPVTCDETLDSVELEGRDSVCHAGMDQLRDFLEGETDSPDRRHNTCETSSKNMKEERGAVNRLGHSSAIEQLKQIAAGEPA